MSKREELLTKKLSSEQLVIDNKFKENLKQTIVNIEGKKDMAEKKSLQLGLKELMRQKKVLYSGGLVMLLLLATTVYALDNRSKSLARQTEIEDTVALPLNLNDVLGVDEMTTLAQSDAPQGATVASVEIENEHGAVLYKVKFSDGSFRLYDAVTGLPYVDTEKSSETSESVPAGFVAEITVQQARDLASAQRPGKTITKIELETEEGKVVYSVQFSDGGRVDVSATDGTILRVRQASTSTTQNATKTSSSSNSSDDSNAGSDTNKDSDDSKDSEDHAEEDTEDDGDKSGSDSHKDEDSHSGSSNSGSGR